MKIQTFIFKIYIFMLPWMLFPFFIPFKNFFSSSASISNDFFILTIGLILFFFINKGRLFFPKNTLVVSGIKLCIVLNIISFITSLVLYIPFGELHGENTLKASFPNIIYMFLTATVFYYNAMMFQIVKKEMIIKILDCLSIVLIFIGFLQLMVIKLPNIDKIYDIFNFMNILVDSSVLQQYGQICLSCSEASYVCNLVTILLLPYLLSQVLVTNILKYKIYSISFILLCYFTYSSTVYTGVIINMIVFAFLYIKTFLNKKLIANIIIFLCIISLFVIFCSNYILNSTSVGEKIQYLLINKTTSQENLSTLVRYSTVKVDMKAFIHYPLTGVGNGNQGYFYNDVIENSMPSITVLQYSEFSKMLDGNTGIVNGGAFLPAFISGYGLVGIILLVLFIRKCVLYVNKNSKEYGCFSYMYYIGGITFLFLSVVSTGLDGNFINIFVVSIPFMQKLYR